MVILFTIDVQEKFKKYIMEVKNRILHIHNFKPVTQGNCILTVNYKPSEIPKAWYIVFL